jgi:dTDP-4-dehydrorhamnose reductase
VIVVTGGNGQMGRALRDHLPNAVYLGREELDVTDEGSVFAAFDKYLPSTVIHLAAITDHQCPDIGKLIHTNIIGTQYLAKYAEPCGVKMVYLSTHYVYPGERGGYQEGDLEKPIGSYAWTKFAGEQATNRLIGRLIIRGSWYTKEKLELWKKHGALDAFCSREPIAEAAKKIATLVKENAVGTYNIGGERRTFYQISKDEGYDPQPVTRENSRYPFSYPFPCDSSVNTDKYDAFVQAA